MIDPSGRFESARIDGIELEMVTSADAGLRLARARNPDAIIMDAALPDLDGWILLDVLKHDRSTRHIPVLALCHAKDGMRARRLGAFEHAPAPRSPEEIDRCVRAALRFAPNAPRRLLNVGPRALEWPGLDVVHAPNARTALAAAAAKPPDCAVMPPVLEDSGALELIDRLHRASISRSILGIGQGGSGPILGIGQGGSGPIAMIIDASDQPPIELPMLSVLADAVIEQGPRSEELLTDAIARALHLPESALPEDRQRHLQQVHRCDPALNGRAVMIVDDDIYDVFALTSALERHSIEVSFCESVRQAISSLGRRTVDAILMNFTMPEDPTYAAPLSPSIPIIQVPKPIDFERVFGELRHRLLRVQHG